MDWHLTETGNTSTGWTGYTWNPELFPDPAGLFQQIHDLGLKTSLNLHPAEGIHPHESQYAEFANFMGIKPETGQPVPFDPADPHFIQGYFELLHHPIEDQGLDFWWLDWQQGHKTRLSGLDPLWWLNHLHFYDLMRNGTKRPFIFSRWGGLGNHRYPIGFSGDTVVGWQALDFQPGFTTSAANVGYGWWSHDIGGHMGGLENDELYTRWVQYGVFSPILRLHSTNNPYNERLPWGRGIAAYAATASAMRLRRTDPLLVQHGLAQYADQPAAHPTALLHASDERASLSESTGLLVRQRAGRGTFYPARRPRDRARKAGCMAAHQRAR
jgi:alpha-glucosidase (family GH31 glycosyl hydrolase)